MKPETQTIDALIFDSGVGGLSVLREILNLRPQLSFAYIADNAGLPYGDKSAEWLNLRVSSVIQAALTFYSPKILVIACNTASTLVLPTLRADLRLPVVGVVPAIKPAARLSKNRIIGLLATPATVSRPYIDQLIQDFASDCQVIRVGSSKLVEMVEAKLRGNSLDLEALRSICKPFLEASPGPDTLVLGCTHFPLIHTEIQSIVPAVTLIDSGAAIAQRVQALLGDSLHIPSRHNRVHFTDLNAGVLQLGNFFAQHGMSSLESLTIDSK